MNQQTPTQTSLYHPYTIKYKTYTRRLVGINAPSILLPEGQVAARALSQKILGKEVIIKIDPEHPRDEYGRVLGVVLLDGENINVWMLRNAYAKFYLPEPNALVNKEEWKAEYELGKRENYSLPLKALTEAKNQLLEALRKWRTNIRSDIRSAISIIKGRLQGEVEEKLDEIEDWFRDEKDKLQAEYYAKKNDIRIRYEKKEIDKVEKLKEMTEARMWYVNELIKLRKKYREKRKELLDPWKETKFQLELIERANLRDIDRQYLEARKEITEEYRNAVLGLQQHLGLDFTPEISLPYFIGKSLIEPTKTPTYELTESEKEAYLAETPPPEATTLTASQPVKTPTEQAQAELEEKVAPIRESAVKEAEERKKKGEKVEPIPSIHAFPYLKRVTVGKHTLRVRARPTTKAPLAGSKYLPPGTKFYVKGWVRGENVAGEDRWWVSMYGNYVWVGGTIEKPEMLSEEAKTRREALKERVEKIKEEAERIKDRLEEIKKEREKREEEKRRKEKEREERLKKLPEPTRKRIEEEKERAKRREERRKEDYRRTREKLERMKAQLEEAKRKLEAQIKALKDKLRKERRIFRGSFEVVNGPFALNVRSCPSTKCSLAGIKRFPPNIRFRAEGWCYGEEVEGEDRWWVLPGNLYCWVGATKTKPPKLDLAKIAKKEITIYPQLKRVTTIYNLNVRACPYLRCPKAGIKLIPRNTSFYVIGWTYGDRVNGENRWWILTDYTYAWVGGTREKP